MAGSDGPDDGAGWRVFVSHTSELRDFPEGLSYVAAVERAISACGHVIVDMADFPAADQPAAELCRKRVRGCRGWCSCWIPMLWMWGSRFRSWLITSSERGRWHSAAGPGRPGWSRRRLPIRARLGSWWSARCGIWPEHASAAAEARA